MNHVTTESNTAVVTRGTTYSRQASNPQSVPFKRAVIYLRVSTTDQAERGRDVEGFSLPAQREACFRKAAEIGAEVVDEYVDRGESAKTADRPALTLMFDRLRTISDVDVVIVHKIDRLARNRADDANLTLAIYQHGAVLVSCTESIDSTPSGKLVHGIMASINEWYSSNLGTEALKGMTQKAKAGGTPGRAAIGYLNTPEMIDGRAIPSVTIDPERSDHVQWAFQTYAKGHTSISELTEELERRGLRTVPSKKRSKVPLQRSRVNAMLSNRYYIGVVTFRGVEYQGNHPRLVSDELFQKVQQVLKERNIAGEKRRTHHSYLKGSIFCKRCGSRLIFSRNRGHGGTYDYFFCIGRRRGCTQPYVESSKIEEAVVRFYGNQVSLGDTLVRNLRSSLKASTDHERSDLERQAHRQQKQLVKLEQSRKRLLDAYLGGAFDLAEFKIEQDKIVGQISSAKRAVEAKETRWSDIEITFDQVLYLSQHCGQAYELANSATRRKMNQAIFEKILIDSADVAGAIPTKPFSAVLANDVAESGQQIIRTPGHGYPQGSNTACLAAPTGFEPVSPP
jgi:DNA invertase Pin-like site-specific DNA recombinase